MAKLYLARHFRVHHFVVDFSSLAYALQAADGTLHLTRHTCRASVIIYEGACLVQVADSPFTKRGEPVAIWGVEACVVASERAGTPLVRMP